VRTLGRLGLRRSVTASIVAASEADLLELYEAAYTAHSPLFLAQLYGHMGLHFSGDPQVFPLEEYLFSTLTRRCRPTRRWPVSSWSGR